jgi:hypothetical protein
VAFVAFGGFLVEDEVRTELVDRVVGQMHELVIEVVGFGHFIGLRAQSSQPLIIHKNPQRICARNEHINPQVELKPLDQERFAHVPLNYAFLILQLLKLVNGYCRYFW